MITWITRISFLDTAEDLDLDALAQQQYEARQLLAHLSYDTADEPVSQKHPINAMWEGYELALAAYAQSMTLTMAARGVPFGTQGHQISQTARWLWEEGETFQMPLWHQDTDIMRSHRSNLARRYPERFGDTWSKTPLDLPYLWPFPNEDGYRLLVSKFDKELLASGERSLPQSIAQRVENL